MPDQIAYPSNPIPRVLLLALNYRPSDRVLAYASQLRNLGVDVDLVVPDPTNTAEIELPPGVRVHPLLSDERSLPVRRIERFLVYGAPGTLLAAARRLTAPRWLRPLDAALATAERGHQRAAGAFHHRLFVPFYRQVRPWSLARSARQPLRRLDVAAADRIVAADISAVPLGWRLARRHPGIPATTTLDSKLYAREVRAA